MNFDAKIYIAGHQGLVGSALSRALEKSGYTQLIARTFEQLDLRDKQAVDSFFAQEKPEYVFLAAAKVGGIKANMDMPASFIYDNLAIQLNVIHAAYTHGVKKLLFLGSSCIYPRDCPQPIKEEYLMTGLLETTNDAYALAKIAGIKMCQAYNKQYGTRFIACMPTNLYGPGDTFDLHNSHVLPALIAKFVSATKNNDPYVTIWGSGNPKREFLYVDDLADACLFLMRSYEDSEIINIGTGQDLTILELTELIQAATGFKGALRFDSSQPDGTPRKLLNIDRIKALGWQPKTSLEDGIALTLNWYSTQNQ